MIALPQSIIYAGLAGVVISLIVATATQRWQLRVFFLLALRIAVGWHFMFEGLHKVHSRYVGVTETNRVFTSEPYFAAGEGPLADTMRRDYLGDPVAIYTARLTQPTPMTPEKFNGLSSEQQAALCPESVATELTNGAKEVDLQKLEQSAVKLKEAADKVPEGMTDPEKKKKSEAVAKANVAARKVYLARDEGREMKAAYAGWIYGATGREVKVKFVSGDLEFTGPQRLQHIQMLEKDLKTLEDRQKSALGRGDGVELTKTKTSRADLLAAKNDLAKDTDTFINELRTTIDASAMAPPTKEKMKDLDKMTAYAITAIGACVLFGLFTPLACVAGAGFLAMTYLTHPTVPWLSLPPMTEGNPLFVNKNIIEALALLAIAVHPTGRWMGLDALWTWAFGKAFGPSDETPRTAV